ncbi:MAG TPA: GxxExxY protein [Chitinophagaceae bacterium]|nr:GxxExxY protein [Chitinophagaceae bacterium]
MELPFKELTHKIIGCAMEVHRILGPGFQEYIYHRALAIEMRSTGIKFEEEFELPVFYKGEKIGLRRVDFWIENKISLEIKARSDLDNSHLAQGINYIEASNIQAGLLINFGASSLQFKRFITKFCFHQTGINQINRK